MKVKAVTSDIPQHETERLWSHAGFFWVDRRCFMKAIGLGIEAACVYILMCQGTGRRNEKTYWSAKACQTHLGIDRQRRAPILIGKLEESGLITADRSKPMNPKYTIRSFAELKGCAPEDAKSRKKAYVWLPKRLIDGSSQLMNIMRSADPLLLRLAVGMYAVCDPADPANLPVGMISRAYSAGHILDGKGSVALWNFRRSLGGPDTYEYDIFKPHIAEANGTDETLINRVERLVSLGFVEWVPVVYQFEDSESTICELDGDILPEVRDTLEGIDNRTIQSNESNLVFPLDGSFQKPVVRDVLRLKWWPSTRVNSAWNSKRLQEQEAMRSHLLGLKTWIKKAP